MIYKKHPKCAVCKNPNGVKIDKELLQRVPYAEIAKKYEHLFTDTGLTQHIVYSHWMHMKEAVETIVNLAVDHGNLPATLAPAGEPQSPARQRIFNEMLHRRVDEISIMEDLLISGLDDLKGLTPTSTDDLADDDADTKRLRNQVRKDTALITMESAKIKLMAANSAKEQEHVERARLVFRMFEILRSALDVVPEGVKGVIAERLKNTLSQDIEIKELLTMSQRQAREDALVLPVTVVSAKVSDE